MAGNVDGNDNQEILAPLKLPRWDGRWCHAAVPDATKDVRMPLRSRVPASEITLSEHYLPCLSVRLGL